MSMIDRLAQAWAALRGGQTPQVQNDAAAGLSFSEVARAGLFDVYGGGAGGSVAVTDATAMQVGVVYSCLSKLGGVVSQLPLHEYVVKDGERMRDMPATPLWWMLNQSPDAEWTASAWKQWIVRCVKLRGDQHTEILRDKRPGAGGAPIGLRPHHPDCVKPRRVGHRIAYDVFDPVLGTIYTVDQDDMLHFSGFGFDGLSSLSAIKWAARSAIAGELGASSYMVKTITGGGMPRIALEYPNNLNPEQAQQLRESFASIYGNGEGGKLPLVLAHGGKAHELSISPVDLELIASRRMDKQTICEVMGVPPIIIGDSEKTSSWGSGVESITLGWVRFDVAPMLAGWEEEFNRKLFRRSGRFVEFSLDALLRGDSKSQAEAFRAALGGPGTGDGWMSVNEIRNLKNLPRLTDPEADKPFRAQRGTTAPSSGAAT